MKFVGIDVGVNKFYLSWYSDRGEDIETAFCETPEGVSPLLDAKNCLIAVDAPSRTRLKRCGRRQCEEQLGIGGYYATPFDRENAAGWMESGFQLWDFLTNSGFSRARVHPTQGGQIIEVHPTIIFKSLFNPEIEPHLWISRKLPPNKKKAEGKRQRRMKLNELFHGQAEFINRLSIDHIDALIAAHAARQSLTGEVRFFGDPVEGQIWVPIMKRDRGRAATRRQRTRVT